jgi:hypothetical protein
MRATIQLSGPGISIVQSIITVIERTPGKDYMQGESRGFVIWVQNMKDVTNH